MDYNQDGWPDKAVVLERHHVGSGQSHRAAGVVRGLVRDTSVSQVLVETMHFFEEVKNLKAQLLSKTEN
ncbi:MAG: FAD-dependent oxidoreductase [Planctomycetaceae bacterium]